MPTWTSNIPSQVRTFANLAAFPITGSVKTIYIAEDTDIAYYWTGSAYQSISIQDLSGLVPYTGATQDVDLDAQGLDAKFVNVKGTAGAGHLGLKHQSSNATAGGQETVIFAGNDGEPMFKNDGNAVEQIASREWVNGLTFQQTPIVVNSNTTAENDKIYHVVANATFTDPTPVEGRGYVVFVRNGTATIGGVGYGTIGTIVIRNYHSGSWATSYYFDYIASNNLFQSRANLSTNVNTDQASNSKYPSVKAVFDWANSVFTTTSAVASQITTALSGYATQAWVNSQGFITNVVTALGYTPVPDTRILTINGTSLNLSADRTFSAVMLHGNPVNSNAGTGGANRWYGFSDQAITTTETSRRLVITNACTLKNFYVRTSGTQPASGSHVLTVLKNGGATSIVVTIPAGSAAGLFSDTTNSETFNAGDEISVLAVNNASATSSIIISLSIGTP